MELRNIDLSRTLSERELEYLKDGFPSPLHVAYYCEIHGTVEVAAQVSLNLPVYKTPQGHTLSPEEVYLLSKGLHTEEFWNKYE